MRHPDLRIGGLLGLLLLVSTLVSAQKTNFRLQPFMQLGVYGGWNTNENYEFGLCIPLRNDARFLPRPGSIKQEEKKSGNSRREWSSHSFSSFGNQRVERYYIRTPYPIRISLQLGAEKAVVSQVYRPSFGVTLTPFSVCGVIPDYGSRFYLKYLVNHILVDATYLPSVNEYNDTWKVGGGVMWRLPFQRFSIIHHTSFRLMVNYHYRFEENNPFRRDEFTFTLNVTGWEYQRKNGYSIIEYF